MEHNTVQHTDVIRSVCIVRLSALGDALMLVPLVRTLQKCLPEATITWVIARPAYDLVADIEGVEYIIIDKPKTVCDYWRFYQLMRHRQFDVLLATQASLRANLLYPCIRARRKIGYDKHRARDLQRWFVGESVPGGSEHTLEGFLQFARVLGIADTVIAWDIPVPPEDLAWAYAAVPKGVFVVINPVASKPERSWTVAGYIAIIRYLQKAQVAVVLTGGPGMQDRMMADAILEAVTCHDLVGKTKPKQLLAVLALARAVICPDTGPAHMAVAVKTPVIALHAVTNPDISGPYTCKDQVVNAYPRAVKQCLGKEVTEVPWGTQVHHPEAMALIEADEVIRQINLLL